MRSVREVKGYSAFFDEDSDTVSLVSGRLSGAFGSGAEASKFQTAADARRDSELQSLLLMASMMLGGREARGGA